MARKRPTQQVSVPPEIDYIKQLEAKVKALEEHIAKPFLVNTNPTVIVNDPKGIVTSLLQENQNLKNEIAKLHLALDVLKGNNHDLDRK